MADVVLGYTPVNGVAFSASGWSADVWSTTDGVSINGELNGHIQNANFANGELLGPRHVRPGEGFRGEYAGAQETIDVVDLLFGDATPNPAAAAPVAGCAKRVYVPWNSNSVLYTFSAFVTNFRIRKGPAVAQEPVTVGPEMSIAVFIDGLAVASSIRRFPMTYFPFLNPGEALYITCRENVLSHHFDMSYLCNAVTRPASITKGWHDITVKANVPTNNGYEAIYPLYDGTPALGSLVCDHDVMHRLRFGIRSASVLCFP